MPARLNVPSTRALLFWALLPAKATGAADAVRFAAPIKIPLQNPVAVTAGDVDGDGTPEIVTAAVGNRISVLVPKKGNVADWTVTEGPVVGNGTFFVRCADFNGDGRDDLLAADPATNAFVLRSRGNGSFDAPFKLTEARGPRWATAGDLDGDGDLDVASANVNSRSISVYLGGGNGLFSHSSTFVREIGNPHSIEALDFDGDGALDLCSGMDGVGIVPLRGDGHGAFTELPVFTNLGGVRYLSTADLDGDGRGDLATSIALAGRSRGDGTFEVILDPHLPFDIIFPSIADFDGDGSPDVGFTRRKSTAQCKGLGAGAFGPPEEVPLTGQYPYFAATRDLDGDGRADLISADIDASTLTILRGAAGAPTLEAEPRFEDLGEATGAALLDLDGEGSLDLVLARSRQPSLVAFPGAARPGLRAQPGFEAALAETPGALETVDWNLDGSPELIVAEPVAGRVSLLGWAPATGQGPRGSSVEAEGGPAALVPVRLEAGGPLEILVPCPRAGVVRRLEDDGSGRLAAGPSISSIHAPHAVCAADLDGDGALDLAVAGAWEVAVHLARNGGFAAPALVSADAELEHTQVKAVDWDGDGDRDLVLLDVRRGTVVLQRSEGGPPEFRSSVLHERPGISALAVADLEGDGAPEILVASGPADGLAILRADLAGPGKLHYQAAGEAVQILVSDVNGDGALDVAVVGPLEGAMLLAVRDVEEAPRFRRAEVTGDGSVNLTDPVRLLEGLFLGGPGPECPDAADANDDGKLDLTDAVVTLRWLFQGGEAPGAPGPLACGLDPTPDQLPPCLGHCPP